MQLAVVGPASFTVSRPAKMYLFSVSVTDKFTESMYVLANEPSVALYRLQEHVRRSLPELVQHKVSACRLFYFDSLLMTLLVMDRPIYRLVYFDQHTSSTSLLYLHIIVNCGACLGWLKYLLCFDSQICKAGKSRVKGPSIQWNMHAGNRMQLN